MQCCVLFDCRGRVRSHRLLLHLSISSSTYMGPTRRWCLRHPSHHGMWDNRVMIGLVVRRLVLGIKPCRCSCSRFCTCKNHRFMETSRLLQEMRMLSSRPLEYTMVVCGDRWHDGRAQALDMASMYRHRTIVHLEQHLHGCCHEKSSPVGAGRVQTRSDGFA